MELTTQQAEISTKLQDFDAYMEKLVKDWNVPGVGVGIVAADKLVFSKGFGYRDYEKKLPITPKTLFQIGSNTKLFTAVAAGMLVEEGKLAWDEPIHNAVPAIRFYNNELNNTVTLRDMLAHRTGINRHDFIWYYSDFTRKELFERLKYLEPTAQLRETFIYNNLMYAAVGYIIELLSGTRWEEFVLERILKPLEMDTTVYTIADMLKHDDYGVPFTEIGGTNEICQIPYNEEMVGIAPAGAIISNIDEMSHWLIALMNDGNYAGKQVLPSRTLKATLEPAMPELNALGETLGWWELLNPIYGMGRYTASYRGNQLTYHGGSIDGFHSQVSFLPQEKLGVIVFTNGVHCTSLIDIVTYNIYERLLGLNQTPWSDRWLDIRLKSKEVGKKAQEKAGAQQVANTKPSHSLADYVGEYEHPAYGILKIIMKDEQLEFNFRKFQFPLSHFHYDRFDTPDDEGFGKWSVNFLTNPQGDIDKAVMSLDQGEVIFRRKAETLDPQLLTQLAGTYEFSQDLKLQVVLEEDGFLYLVVPFFYVLPFVALFLYLELRINPKEKLIPYKGLTFCVERFSDMTFEFVVENSQVTALKQRVPSGEYVFVRN